MISFGTLENLTPPELLELHAAAADELRRRGLTRSANNPLGDFAEHLFCKAFDWKMAEKSERELDALGAYGVRYQIKARRLSNMNSSRELSALRDLPSRGFDVLAAALFDNSYRLLRAALVPYARVSATARFVQHTNSWRFVMADSVWTHSDVRDVTDEVRAAMLVW